MTTLVVGATGFIGQRLVPALLEEGHDVLAGTRRPDGYEGPGRPTHVDLEDAAGVRSALQGCDAVYYLVHSLDVPDFATRDRRLATTFTDAAEGQVERVVYLGGLGERRRGSPHLRSRHEVGDILAGRLPTVELRASLVLGKGGASYELLVQLVDRLTFGPGPRVVPAPRALASLTQPVSIGDAVRYLTAARDLPPGIYDIGAPEPVSYAQLMQMQAGVTGTTLEVQPVLPVPPGSFAPLAALVTDQAGLTAHALFMSAGDDAVVDEQQRLEVDGHRPATVGQTLGRPAG